MDSGGRTGLTAVFAISILISSLVACVPMAAIVPILILIGVSTMGNIGSIDWKVTLVAIPAFFAIVMMTFVYSITTGIQFGFIFYTLLNVIRGKCKDVLLIIHIFSIIFILQFVYQALFFNMI